MESRVHRWLPVAGILPALILSSLGAETAGSHPAGWFLLAFGVAYLTSLPKFGAMLASLNFQAIPLSPSLWVVITGVLGLLAAAPAEHLFHAEFVPTWKWLESVGLVCVAASVALGVWAIAARREASRAGGPVRQLMALFVRGPYRYVRHPGYSAILLGALGVALNYGSASALGILGCWLLPGLLVRIGHEERKRLELLGASYGDYATRTRRLVPGLW
jgi:protein-S-isoprenylcysteine O-methyltransferase Ste14